MMNINKSMDQKEMKYYYETEEVRTNNLPKLDFVTFQAYKITNELNEVGLNECGT